MHPLNAVEAWREPLERSVEKEGLKGRLLSQHHRSCQGLGVTPASPSILPHGGESGQYHPKPL